MITRYRAMDVKKCEFCMSITLIHHNEGVTCLECSRVSSNVFHIEHKNRVPQQIPEQVTPSL